MRVILPKPPSVNQIYGYTSRGGFARSYITAAGKRFFAGAIKAIKEQLSVENPVDYPLFATVDLYTTRGQDLDNVLKPVFDSLGNLCIECETKFSSRKPCKCGKKLSVIKNDMQIHKILTEKHKVKSKEEERVIVVLEEYAI